ncbi:MAG TPA: alkaline phosphatase family protein [Candidatus Limnocylindrales bacterium]|nr:alkaline phosphatase family protein [Candidatus Limnocylindrales bacterium]
MRSQRVTSCLLLFFSLTSWLINSPAFGQTAQKAIVLAWDGTVSAYVQELLRDGKLPNLAKLIAGGTSADDVVAGFPSKTAPGFASLMTGAPPRITGISGNRVPRAPREQFTILESLPGFSGAPLSAEPIWATAQHAGKKVIVSHIPSFAGEKSEQVVRFAGYELIAGRDGIVTRSALQSQGATRWTDPPPSDTPALEFIFTVGESNFFGLLIDDPADAQVGYDTAVISDSRDGKHIRARLKALTAAPRGELLWSQPIPVKTASNQTASVYFRLFYLQADGSDFFLYHTRPARSLDLPAESTASPTVRTFVGNGASILYQTGGLGRTIANGGAGGAEARYLETMLFAQHQLIETNRWAMENLSWDLFLAYTPFPDEAEHAWRGFLDATLPTYRREIADKLRPFLEQVYRSCDDHLGVLLAKRPADAIFALISDHGLQGIYKRVALNHVLQQNGLLTLDAQGRLDLAKTKVLYPSVNSGYLMINGTERKNGIVSRQERGELVQKVRDILLALRDGELQVVTAVIDAEAQGELKGIGGDTGGDIYIELAPGYDFDPRLRSATVISEIEPQGQHGANPEQPSMRTIMVLNGRAIRAGQKLKNLRIIDFAPTIAWLLNLPKPKEATGRVLYEAFSEPQR